MVVVILAFINVMSTVIFKYSLVTSRRSNLHIIPTATTLSISRIFPINIKSIEAML